MTLDKAINDFKKYIAITKTKATNEFYRYYLRCLSENLGQFECLDINNDVILDYINKMKTKNQKVSNATLNKHITTLKSVIKFSTKNKIEFKKLKEKSKIIPTVSRDSKDIIFKYLKQRYSNKYSQRNYLFLKVLYESGLRLSEITNLKVNDFDTYDSIFHVTKTKTDVDRYVIISEETKNMLIKFIEKNQLKNYIFTNFKEDAPLSTSAIESLIYRLKKKLELSEEITPHKWRHTFATEFLRRGGNLETLRILLGHSSLKTTQKYLHLSKSDILREYRTVMS